MQIDFDSIKYFLNKYDFSTFHYVFCIVLYCPPPFKFHSLK